jgi:hypothetical protein
LISDVELCRDEGDVMIICMIYEPAALLGAVVGQARDRKRLRRLLLRTMLPIIKRIGLSEWPGSSSLGCAAIGGCAV